MTLPDYQTLMRPLLAYASDGQEKNISEATRALADAFNLTVEERDKRVPSGSKTVLANRVSWARTYLDKAGAIRKTRRSHFKITDRGQALLSSHADSIDAATLRQFPEFLLFASGKQDSADVVEESKATSEVAAAIPNSTPEESIQASEEAIAAALRSQLLERIRELSPAFFERLVVDLIVSMGYGGTRDSVVQRLGKSGDEGIDGVVNEDPLGLDVVYIQAKRYAPDNTIGRERIQQFAGALVGQGANKGVFVTTSSFTKGAVEYALRVPQRIILVDGAELTRLMMRYGVGVRTERVIELRRLDLDYFEEAEG